MRITLLIVSIGIMAVMWAVMMMQVYQMYHRHRLTAQEKQEMRRWK